MISPKTESLGDVHNSLCIELDIEPGTRKWKLSRKIASHALTYLNQPSILQDIKNSGLTYEQDLVLNTRRYVKYKMASGIIGSIALLFLSALITSIVRAIVEWYILEKS